MVEKPCILVSEEVKSSSSEESASSANSPSRAVSRNNRGGKKFARKRNPAPPRWVKKKALLDKQDAEQSAKEAGSTDAAAEIIQDKKDKQGLVEEKKEVQQTLFKSVHVESNFVKYMEVVGASVFTGASLACGLSALRGRSWKSLLLGVGCGIVSGLLVRDYSLRCVRPPIVYSDSIPEVSEKELLTHINGGGTFVSEPGIHVETVARVVIKRDKDVRPVVQRVAKSNLDVGNKSVTLLLLNVDECGTRTPMVANSEILNQMITSHFQKNSQDFEASIRHMIRNQSNYNVESVLTTMCNKGTVVAAMHCATVQVFPLGPAMIRRTVVTSAVCVLVMEVLQRYHGFLSMQCFRTSIWCTTSVVRLVDRLGLMCMATCQWLSTRSTRTA